jgi:Ser/Thr protein kinase RdoA (MazF antagonist)
VDWSEHHSRGRFPQTPARVLGRTLAALHSLPVDSIAELPPGADPMWGLSLPEPSHTLVFDLSATAQDVLARVQGSAVMCRQLKKLRDIPSAAAPVHGDLRWDNCLAVAAPGSSRRTRVVLVDWELAGPGLPSFDVGTVLAEYLYSWVASIPIVRSYDPARLASHAGRPLGRMKPAMQAFWSAYSKATAQPPALQRTIELAAVRLLQAALERAQEVAAPSAHVVTLVQLAANMLRTPEEAGRHLMGLRA